MSSARVAKSGNRSLWAFGFASAALPALVLLMAGGCCAPKEAERAIFEEYAVSVERQCSRFEGVDWSVLKDTVDESMFDECTIRINDRRVRLLGFRPTIVSTHQVTGSSMVTPHDKVELVTVAAGARENMWLYLMNTREGLFMAKWFTDQPPGDGAWLQPDEVIYAFRTQDRRLPFELVREDKVYVDSRFFNLMLEHGLCPEGLMPVPDPDPAAQPVQPQGILRAPSERETSGD